LVKRAIEAGKLEVLSTHVLSEEITAIRDPNRRAKLQALVDLTRLVATARSSSMSPESTSAVHTKVESSLIIQLSSVNTLKSPLGARTFWVRAAANVSAGQPQCTVKIVTNRGR
jgi:hypothetical protein